MRQRYKNVTIKQSFFLKECHCLIKILIFAPKTIPILANYTLLYMDIQTAQGSAISLLRTMISIPSVSRDEQAVADMLQQYMTDATHQTVHRHNHNLWLIDPHFDDRKPTLLLNAHIDTVKPAASWQHDPFLPTEETIMAEDGKFETRLYGLGSNDDGASLVSLLHVWMLLTEVPQTYNVIFLASAEEEVSGKNGIESVLPLLPKIDVALVGEPTGMHPAIAEKGLVVLDGVAHGKSGHAARNEGVNALYIALDAIQALRSYRFPEESETLGPVKVTTTGIQAGTTHNVIPDTCTFMIDVRTTDAYSNEQVVEMLREVVNNSSVTLTPRSTRLQPSGIAASHPLLQRIIAQGRTPFGSPTLSDQALMRFPSVKMGPGQSSRSHTADEYIVIEEIYEAISLYWNILNGMNL